jgi:hypothetical protein
VFVNANVLCRIYMLFRGSRCLKLVQRFSGMIPVEDRMFELHTFEMCHIYLASSVRGTHFYLFLALLLFGTEISKCRSLFLRF